MRDCLTGAMRPPLTSGCWDCCWRSAMICCCRASFCCCRPWSWLEGEDWLRLACWVCGGCFCNSWFCCGLRPPVAWSSLSEDISGSGSALKGTLWLAWVCADGWWWWGRGEGYCLVGAWFLGWSLGGDF